jgi:lipopolysaccharide/colanic/teichoic acid biosynthesis glycosyltransferase
MSFISRREHLVLLFGDVCIFVASLWCTLLLRYLAVPSWDILSLHFVPFILLFVVWIAVFFIAGLYGKHTRLFRSKLPTTIVSSQVVNIFIAAMLFFFVPVFGIAPKTNLILYLVISTVLIVIWRLGVFPRLGPTRQLKGVLIAAGPDAKELAEEVNQDHRYPFKFEYVIDTSKVPVHEIIQKAVRVAEEDDVMFVVVDYADSAVASALPIIYDAAFHKERFALIDIVELYQEAFERVPITLTSYAWILDQVGASRSYDIIKRGMDILIGGTLGILSFVLYPFVILAIKLDDGGPIFITQERVGRAHVPIKVLKFRSMSGNDSGKYDQTGKTKLKITRVGRWLRVLRIDELPQLWAVVRGDLSLVGPRPELPALANQYSARIPYYNARYLVAPGLTGWAQIKHDAHPHHGTAMEATKEKLSYDLYYLQHRSLMLDLVIILQTIRIVLTAKGT